MRSSKYNIMFSENDDYVLLNTYSKKIVKVNKDSYEKVKNILDSENRDFDQEDEVVKKLAAYKFLVSNEDESFEKLKQECRELVMSKTLHITMMMTYMCNFSCIYCFQNHISNSIMTDEMVENTISFVRKQIEEKQIERLYVEWFGGEPLLLKEKMLYLHKNFRKITKEFKIPYYSRITTNGYELDLDTFNELYKNHCFVYYISLDGTKEIHDKQRPHKTKGGTYDVIINNLKAIHEKVPYKNFRIEVRVNNSASTIGSLKQFIVEFQTVFEDDSRFALVLDSIQDWGERTSSMQDELIEKNELSQFAELASSLDVNLADFSLQSLETQVCQGAKHNAFSIFYDGSIIKCQMALERDEYKKINVIGNVGEGIDAAKENNWVDDKIPENCEHCIALPLCYGKKCVFSTKVMNESCSDIERKLVEQIKLEKIMCDGIEEI